jgi:hypothetical protein
MSYEIKQGDLFGRIGTGVGKGLAETVPKEVERYRLSSGLRQFEQEAPGLTPLQQYTRLAAIPGMTPEHLYTIQPLLRQQMQREEGTKAKSGQTSPEQPTVIKIPSEKKESKEPKPFQDEEKEAGKKRSVKTIEQTRTQLVPIVMRSDQELYPEAQELSRQNPSTYPTPNDALPIVRQNEQTRVANLQEERNVANAADTLTTRAKQGLQAHWGKEATAKGIPETVQTRLLQNLEEDLADPKNKLSEAQLIKKYGEAGKNIAMQNTLLNERSKHWLSTEYMPSKIHNTIDTARKVFKQAGATEEFQDIISNKFNLTGPRASYLSDPPENKAANKIISKLPYPKVNTYGIPSPDDARKIAIQAADQITSLLRDEDSISSYAMAVKNKGGDAEAFLERINQNKKLGMFKPTARHDREIGKGIPLIPSLGDFWLFGLMGQENLLE